MSESCLDAAARLVVLQNRVDNRRESIRRSVQRHVESAHSALAVRKSVSEGGLQPAFLVLRRSEDVFVELRSVALEVAESGHGVLRVDESRFAQLDRTQVAFRVADEARKSSIGCVQSRHSRRRQV